MIRHGRVKYFAYLAPEIAILHGRLPLYARVSVDSFLR
jgi:hypothetical protein